MALPGLYTWLWYLWPTVLSREGVRSEYTLVWCPLSFHLHRRHGCLVAHLCCNDMLLLCLFRGTEFPKSFLFNPCISAVLPWMSPSRTPSCRVDAAGSSLYRASDLESALDITALSCALFHGRELWCYLQQPLVESGRCFSAFQVLLLL